MAVTVAREGGTFVARDAAGVTCGALAAAGLAGGGLDLGLPDAAGPAVADALLAAATAGMPYAQCLLPAGGDASPLMRAGFARVTDMVAMTHAGPTVPPPAGLVPYDADPAGFRAAFAAGEDGSLDLPELRGLVPPGELLDALGTPADRRHWRLAPAGGVVVLTGTCGPAWELAYLAVAPAARRRGLGTALAAHAVAAAADAGAALLLLVDARNVAARSLYAKLGFAETGRRAYALWRPRGG